MPNIITLFLVLALYVLLNRASPIPQDADDTPRWTFVPSPRTRGTNTILSTTCAALIASTWAALHLNILKQRLEGDRSGKHWAKTVFHDLASPMKWTAAAIIAPEALVGFAFSDWMHARKTESILRNYGKGDMQSWDRTQVHFANMGGFVFHNKEASQSSSRQARTAGLSSAIELTSMQSTGGAGSPSLSHQENETEAVSPTDSAPSSTSDTPGAEEVEYEPSTSMNREDFTVETVKIYLNATQILLAQEFGILKKPPQFSTAHIEDKSKNTPFAKIFLLLPIIVLAYIVIARLYSHLSVSQLELAVCTYGICTTFAYVFYWSKPQSVRVPEVSSRHQLRWIRPNDEHNLAIFGGTSFIHTNFFPPFGAGNNTRRKITDNILNDNVVGIFGIIFGTVLHNSDFASILIGTIFGALYCLGWNNVFPTATERWLWRASSVIVTSGLIPYAGANTYFTTNYRKSETHTDIRQKIGLYFLLSCYVLARVFLIWEMFWSLFYQPEETFESS
ncbi:uncharacterized protein BDZ99DRAFT_442287 [Mytilinidion resinicola]|uniref:Uncharacterized protein n=1 Tax=Mytilinidion resinicola TaxID=574789 RepID=A0A6A6YN19_9PEZI|nr:uncharacterized protein BDZ99DRAFT_442287 [Mytilinidion resinicola]KAF2809938.1 hypothetical protein BDZ99DRAFT_442287 [Mytilinidion resinicola]